MRLQGSAERQCTRPCGATPSGAPPSVTRPRRLPRPQRAAAARRSGPQQGVVRRSATLAGAGSAFLWLCDQGRLHTKVMLLSTLFTLVLGPTVFLLWLAAQTGLRSLFRRTLRAPRKEVVTVLERNGMRPRGQS